MDRHTFARLKKTANRVGPHLLIMKRNAIQQPLRLRTIVRKIILPRVDLQAGSSLKVSYLGCFKGQFVPTRRWRLKGIVEKRVAVSVVRSRPRKKNPILVGTRVLVVGRKAILQSARYPRHFRKKTPARQSKIDHFLACGEVSGKTFTSHLNAFVGIVRMGTAILRKIMSDGVFNSQQIIHAVIEFKPTFSARDRSHGKFRPGRENLKHFLAVRIGWLLRILGRHPSCDQILESKRSIHSGLRQSFFEIETTLRGRGIMAVHAVGFKSLQSTCLFNLYRGTHPARSADDNGQQDGPAPKLT